MKRYLIQKLIWPLVLLVGYSTGCSSVSAPATTQTPVISESASGTPVSSITNLPSKPSLTSTPTSTDTSIATSTRSPTATLMPTSTPFPGFPIREQPITVSSNLESAPKGTIVLVEVNAIYGAPLWLYELQNDETISLGEAFNYVAISPDSTQLAFMTTDHVLKIANARGVVEKTKPGPSNWRGIIDWADPTRLLIENMPLFADGTIDPPASSLLLDLATGEQRDYPPLYPLLPFGAPNWGNYAFTNAVYDHQFTRAVYLGDDPSSYFVSLNLYDLEIRQDIAWLKATDLDCAGGPKWLNDGSAFFSCFSPQYQDLDDVVHFNVEDRLPFIGGYELAQVSRNGELKRLTYLTTEYLAAEEGIALSPDETRIAFWLNLNYSVDSMEQIRHLAILEIETGEITRLTFQGGDFPYPPVWSPDGKYLVVTVSNFKSQAYDVFLVDLERGKAMKIAEEAVAKGWMIDSDK